MTDEELERWEERLAEIIRRREAALMECGAAGACQAGLITLMASADAFAARLTASTQHAAELSTLQLRQLATSLADMQPSRGTRAQGFGLSAAAHAQQATPYGAPVVT